MTDPKARERLVAILEQANSDSWKIGATVEEILAAGFRLPEAAPSGNEAVEAERGLNENLLNAMCVMGWEDASKRCDRHCLECHEMLGHILPTIKRYILSFAPPMPPTPVNSLPTQSVSLAPGKDALEMANDVVRGWTTARFESPAYRSAAVNDIATAITAAVEKERAEYDAIFRWLFGEEGEFPERQPGQGAYYWRSQLRKRLEAIRARRTP